MASVLLDMQNVMHYPEEAQAFNLDTEEPELHLLTQAQREYLAIRLDAHSHRLAGRIQQALACEVRMDAIFDHMPSEVKW